MTDALVDAAWLGRHLGAPDVRVVDATWFMPGSGRDAKAEYAAAHIPGAVYFDIDEIADEASPYPHMAPSAAKFSARARRLGLGDGVRAVVYDNNRFFASARAWWLLRLFGHEDVAVLDGGLPAWRGAGQPLDDAPARPAERHLSARFSNLLVRELDQIRADVAQGRGGTIVDARSRGRFAGTEPEPRPGLRPGHIPGSRNLPWDELVRPDGRLRSAGELAAAFRRAGIDTGGPVVASCGSGVSAAVLALALFELGQRSAAVYDGSWSEWGARTDTPVAR